METVDADLNVVRDVISETQSETQGWFRVYYSKILAGNSQGRRCARCNLRGEVARCEAMGIEVDLKMPGRKVTHFEMPGVYPETWGTLKP